jgi:dolichyl-diphosphooligosaccharide--protein glycosyltransferase
MTLKDSLKKFFIEEPKVETVSESKETEIKLPNIPVKNKNLLYWLSLIPVFFIALYVRTRNLPLLQGKYLIELDSYFFFRYAKMLLEQGSLPTIDYMRYLPVGFPTKTFVFFPKTMVYFYKIAHFFFSNLSQIEWHIIYPPVITVVSLIFFFLFVKELLGHRTAFITTAFLAVIPAYLQRTMAGFADHEAFGMLWVFIALWLFVLAWKSEDWKKFIPFAALSGIFAAALFATWGGFVFTILGISLFAFAYAVLTNKSIKPLLRLLPFMFTYLLFSSFFSAQSLISLIRAMAYANVALVSTVLFSIVLLFVNKSQILSKLRIPSSILALGISAIITLPINFIAKFVDLSAILTSLTKQGETRIFFTVSENAQPYFFNDWWGGFGFIFLLAFFGAALYFYKLFDPEGKSKFKLHWLATAAFVLFILTFIFGRLSSSGSPIVSFFSSTYLYWMAIFAILLLAVYLLAYYADKNHLQNIENKWVWILLSVWLLITLVAARGQVRLLFATVPPIAIAAGFFVSEIVNWAKKQEKTLKIVTILAVALISMFVFAFAAQSTLSQNEYSGSMTPGQWGDAMNWVRENTPEESVFAHWWDYGYLTIAVGERAAVTDGGNLMAWNHQSGRYFLTGKDENSTLTYLKTHNVTHILISEEEISKYYAFSYIGSDENLDRRSTIGVFGLQEMKEVRNGTLLLYGGSWGLDKDYLIDNLILPEGQAGIYGFAVPSDLSSQTPQAFVSYNNQQFTFDIPCIVKEGQRTDFETNPNATLNGCLVLVPYIQDQTNMNPIGAAFWASEKVWDTNFARLYLYDAKDPNFKLVYKDDMPLALYQGRIIGPIKIWEVEYPANVKPDSDYLQSSPHG